jgi:hypothetical protein
MVTRGGFALAFVIVALTAGPALAQESQRPSDAADRRSLEVSGSVVEAYDGDVPREVAALGSSANESRGYSTMFLASLRGEWLGSRAQFGANATSALRHYQELDEFRSLSHTVGLGLSSRLWRRGTLGLSQTAAYSPSYLYSLFPSIGPVALGDAPVGAPDYVTSDSESYTYGTSATLTHALSRRSSSALTTEVQHTDFLRDETRQDVTAYSLKGLYSHSLTRNTTLSAVYNFRTGDLVYGTDQETDRPTSEWQKTTEYGVDLGLSHSRPLSAARRVFVNISIGTSKLDAPRRDALSEGLGYRLSGSTEFGYQFLPSWQVRAAYRRGVEFVPDLAEPVFLDGMTGALVGNLTESVSMTTQASYSNGESAFARRNFAFDTYTANVRFDWRVWQQVAVHSEYILYYYDFGRSALLPPGLPSAFERNGVRIGLTFRVRPIRG